jgi:hypothetical protein
MQLETVRCREYDALHIYISPAKGMGTGHLDKENERAKCNQEVAAKHMRKQWGEQLNE